MIKSIILTLICVAYGYECEKYVSLERYVELNRDICLRCPHVRRSNVYWKFTSSNDKNINKFVMVNDTITNIKKYTTGTEPFNLVIRNVSVDDIGSYYCGGSNDRSISINLYLINRVIDINPLDHRILCTAYVIRYRIKWTTAPIGTPIERTNLWTEMKSSIYQIITVTTTGSYACLMYNTNGDLYGVSLHDVYVRVTLCDVNPTYCMNGGSCNSTSLTMATCKCTFAHTGYRCYSLSVYFILTWACTIIATYVICTILIEYITVGHRRIAIVLHGISVIVYIPLSLSVPILQIHLSLNPIS